MMTVPDASEPAFRQRVNRYMAHAADAAMGWYDANGVWKAPSLPAANRERLWLCFSLYGMDNGKLADAVIRQDDAPQYRQIRYNIFDTNIAAALLTQHRQQMSDDVREKLEQLVRDGFSFLPGNRQPDYQFHGYNDNMPAKATMGLVLGGEMLDEPEALAYGLWDLRQFRAMLVRRGINSEYNSPTYTALTMHAMGEIAEHARNEEARELALGIEERLWIDLAARFHPETGLVAGPYSRAYTVDTIGLMSCVNAMLWFALGDCVTPNPMLLFDPPEGYVVHHMGDYPFCIAQVSWFAGGSYHIPPKALELFTRKSYPFHAAATAEVGDFGPDFQARPVRIETHLEADFTQGTALSPFGGGEQTMSWFVTYRRTPQVRSYREVGTVFTKLFVDDEEPGIITGPDDAYTNRGESDHAKSLANTLAIQNGRAALVLTHPHLALGGKPDTSEGAKPLHRLSECIIFPTHDDKSVELIVDGKPRAEWSGDLPRGSWIVCRRGRLLIGIRPLVYTHDLGQPRLELVRLPQYDMIRTTFYGGESRCFSRQEMRQIHGGFVAETASVDDYPSLAGFAAAMQAASFTDYYFMTRRVRYRRADKEMEVSWSAGSTTPRHATINGRELDWSPVQIDTVEPLEFPFLGENFKSVPSFFQWEDFRIEWMELPWAIGDREG